MKRSCTRAELALGDKLVSLTSRLMVVGRADVSPSELQFIVKSLRDFPKSQYIVNHASQTLHLALLTTQASSVRAASAALDAGVVEALVPCLFVVPEAEKTVMYPWRALSSLLVGSLRSNIERVAAAGGAMAALRAVPELYKVQSPNYNVVLAILATFLKELAPPQRAELLKAGALKVRSGGGAQRACWPVASCSLLEQSVSQRAAAARGVVEPTRRAAQRRVQQLLMSKKLVNALLTPLPRARRPPALCL